MFGVRRSRIMNTRAILFMAIAALCFGSFIYAGQESPSNHAFALGLRPIESSTRLGTIPKFRLTLTNISDRTCPLLNIERRVDLQHTYFELIVTTNGEPVRVPRAIS